MQPKELWHGMQSPSSSRLKAGENPALDPIAQPSDSLTNLIVGGEAQRCVPSST